MRTCTKLPTSGASLAVKTMAPSASGASRWERPRNSPSRASVTSTFSTVPMRAWLFSREICACSFIRRSRRSCLTSSGIWSGISAAGVFSSGEKAKAPMRSNRASATKSISSWNCSSVSPGKPTIRLVRRVKPMSRAFFNMRRMSAAVPRRFMRRRSVSLMC